jgi:CxxC-x17-CxxC domain-containing protein
LFFFQEAVMPFKDKTLTCRDCGTTFVFTAGEQEFYQQKGFVNPPSRCPDCRQKRKQPTAEGSPRTSAGRSGPRGETGGRPRQLYTVICAECGAETQVPFQPRGDRPVYCRDCYDARRR